MFVKPDVIIFTNRSGSEKEKNRDSIGLDGREISLKSSAPKAEPTVLFLTCQNVKGRSVVPDSLSGLQVLKSGRMGNLIDPV